MRGHRVKEMVPAGGSNAPVLPICADPYCLMDGVERHTSESREAFVTRLRQMYLDGHLGVPAWLANP